MNKVMWWENEKKYMENYHEVDMYGQTYIKI